jgi:DNA-binding transcriptional MerR regulator
VYIGKLAELSRCTPKAIRLYEKLGLLPEPKRRGTYRVYTPHHLDIVRIIRTAQSVGFKLGEMNTLIEAKKNRDHFPLDLANQGIESKRLQLQAQIEALQLMDVQLVALKGELNQLFAADTTQRCVEHPLVASSSIQTPS